MANIEERVETLVKPTIENLGYELYDVQYVKEGKDYFLRIFIEKENGAISLEDCEKVNNEIEEMLDTQDYIKQQYFLEISSTGIEKIIRKEKHLQENLEQDICVKLYKPINNNKEYVGKLKKFDDEIIYLQVNNEIVELERKNISLIKGGIRKMKKSTKSKAKVSKTIDSKEMLLAMEELEKENGMEPGSLLESI